MLSTGTYLHILTARGMSHIFDSKLEKKIRMRLSEAHTQNLGIGENHRLQYFRIKK